MNRMELVYFRPDGSYQGQGFYNTRKLNMSEIRTEIRSMRENGKLPDVVGSSWTIYAKLMPDFAWAYPILIPLED